MLILNGKVSSEKTFSSKLRKTAKFLLILSHEQSPFKSKAMAEFPSRKLFSKIQKTKKPENLVLL